MKIASWRIVQSRHLPSAFSGEGAKLFPGRWNHRGFPMVYTAGSLSLAAMEMLVHLDTSEALRLYVCVPVTFERRVCRTLSLTDLPGDWADHPPPESTRDVGTAWLKSNESPVLAVPSAVVHMETCYLFNPLHPDYGKLEIGLAKEFPFDPRLLGQGRGGPKLH